MIWVLPTPALKSKDPICAECGERQVNDHSDDDNQIRHNANNDQNVLGRVKSRQLHCKITDEWQNTAEQQKIPILKIGKSKVTISQ